MGDQECGAKGGVGHGNLKYIGDFEKKKTSKLGICIVLNIKRQVYLSFY